MATEIKQGVVYEITADNKTGAAVDEAVRTAEEGAKKVADASRKTGDAALKGFNPLRAVTAALHGNFGALGAEIAKIVPGFAKMGLAGTAAAGAVGAAITGIIGLVSSLKDLVTTAFNLDQVPDDVKRAAAAMAELGNETERFAARMAEARETSERQTKHLMDQADAIAAMTRAQNEYNRQLEIAAAKSPGEREAVGRKYDTIDAEASEEAAAAKRDIRRDELDAEARRLRDEIREAKRVQKVGRGMLGDENTRAQGADLYWEQAEKLEELQKSLEDNRHASEMLDREDETAEVERAARVQREANAERARAEEDAEKAKKDAEREAREWAREEAEYERELAEAAREEARAIAEEQKRAEAELHAQKLRDIADQKAAVAQAAEEQRGAEARLAAARSQVQQAWGWYRDKDSMRAQLEEEKAEAAAQAQFEKDFDRLKSFRHDWRTAKNLSVDDEAVRRVALAKEEKSAAQEAVFDAARAAREAADSLAAIERAVTEEP